MCLLTGRDCECQGHLSAAQQRRAVHVCWLVQRHDGLQDLTDCLRALVSRRRYGLVATQKDRAMVPQSSHHDMTKFIVTSSATVAIGERLRAVVHDVSRTLPVYPATDRRRVRRYTCYAV